MRAVILGEGNVGIILLRQFIKRLEVGEKFILFSLSSSSTKEEVFSKLQEACINFDRVILHLHFSSFSFEELGATFHQERIKKVLIGGRFNKLAAIQLPCQIKDQHTISRFFIESFNKLGIEVEDQLSYLGEYLCPPGILTRSSPTGEDYISIQYGLKIAKEIALLGIGQAVTIKNGVILGVEGAEGTDKLIYRTGCDLGIDGFILIKVAAPQQDTRLELPVVGKDTIKALINSKGRILAMEATKVLFLDREEAIKLANDKNIIIIGV
jgi:DUF1009 family protein